MSDVCYGCGRPKVVVSDYINRMNDEIEWHALSRLKVGETYQVSKWFNGGWQPQGSVFTLLQKETFGQESQGETTNCFVVYRSSADGKTYKKLGLGDSYGDIEWDGALFEVKVAKKMVEAWEVVED